MGVVFVFAYTAGGILEEGGPRGSSDEVVLLAEEVEADLEEERLLLPTLLLLDNFL